MGLGLGTVHKRGYPLDNTRDIIDDDCSEKVIAYLVEYLNWLARGRGLGRRGRKRIMGKQGG